MVVMETKETFRRRFGATRGVGGEARKQRTMITIFGQSRDAVS